MLLMLGDGGDLGGRLMVKIFFLSGQCSQFPIEVLAEENRLVNRDSIRLSES